MLDYTVSTEQLAELRAAHRRTRDQREADRIKAVVSLVALIIIPPNLFSPDVAAPLQNMFLRAQTHMGRPALSGFVIKASLTGGWPAEQVAKVLLIDSNTVHDHFLRYQQGGLPGLLHMAYQGSDCALTDTDLVALDVPVQAHLYLTAKDVAAWVSEEFGVTYTASGMTALLPRLGFVYKKTKRVLGKADPKAQEALLAEYETLKQDKGGKRRHLLHGRGPPTAQPGTRVWLDKAW